MHVILSWTAVFDWPESSRTVGYMFHLDFLCYYNTFINHNKLKCYKKYCLLKEKKKHLGKNNTQYY